MAQIIIDLGEITVTLNFSTFDAYTATPLGCHAGLIGNFNSTALFNTPGKNIFGTEKTILDFYREKDVYRKIMDKLLEGATQAFGGWTMGNGSDWRKKGHWIISAPWKAPNHTTTTFYTAEIMDIIAQYCDAEPEKYGHYSMTEPSDCGAHDNNAGFPATRTLVWMPAYVKINKDKLKTRASNVYTPVQAFVGPPKPPEPKKPDAPVDARGVLRQGSVPEELGAYAEVAPGGVGEPPGCDMGNGSVKGTDTSEIRSKTLAGGEVADGQPSKVRDPYREAVASIADAVDQDILQILGYTKVPATMETIRGKRIRKKKRRETVREAEVKFDEVYMDAHKPKGDHGLPIEAVRMGEPIPF